MESTDGHSAYSIYDNLMRHKYFDDGGAYTTEEDERDMCELLEKYKQKYRELIPTVIPPDVKKQSSDFSSMLTVGLTKTGYGREMPRNRVDSLAGVYSMGERNVRVAEHAISGHSEIFIDHAQTTIAGVLSAFDDCFRENKLFYKELEAMQARWTSSCEENIKRSSNELFSAMSYTLIHELYEVDTAWYRVLMNSSNKYYPHTFPNELTEKLSRLGIYILPPSHNGMSSVEVGPPSYSGAAFYRLNKLDPKKEKEWKHNFKNIIQVKMLVNNSNIQTYESAVPKLFPSNDSRLKFMKKDGYSKKNNRRGPLNVLAYDPNEDEIVPTNLMISMTIYIHEGVLHYIINTAYLAHQYPASFHGKNKQISAVCETAIAMCEALKGIPTRIQEGINMEFPPEGDMIETLEELCAYSKKGTSNEADGIRARDSAIQLVNQRRKNHHVYALPSQDHPYESGRKRKKK